MTFILTVLIGAGTVFIASALDNTPLISTLQKIISNQPIDWSGSGSSSTATTAAVSTQNATPATAANIQPQPGIGNTV
jgi:hypothetical protein